MMVAVATELKKHLAVAEHRNQGWRKEEITPG
jgi:hypothetical protein